MRAVGVESTSLQRFGAGEPVDRPKVAFARAVEVLRPQRAEIGVLELVEKARGLRRKKGAPARLARHRVHEDTSQHGPGQPPQQLADGQRVIVAGARMDGIGSRRVGSEPHGNQQRRKIPEVSVPVAQATIDMVVTGDPDDATLLGWPKLRLSHPTLGKVHESMPITIYGESNPDHNRFKVSRDAIIWRYMNIPRFFDLLTKNKIWFARAVELRKTDPYEGALTTSDREMVNRVLATKDKNALRSLWPSIATFMDCAPGMSVHYFQLIFLSTLPRVEMNAYTHSLSCWHENSHESDAMWALYAQRNAGIAIKSTVRRVLDAFAASPRIMRIAKINYDSQSSLSAMTSGNYDSLLVKRPAFHHENEIRIIAGTYDGYEAPEWTQENQRYNIDLTKIVPPGVYIDCDLHSLIEEVVISPLTPTYGCEAIENIAKTLMPSISVRRSNLLSKEEDLLWEQLSPELKLLWDHYRRTHLLLDVDELSLSQKALNARRSQKVRSNGNTAASDTDGRA